MRELVDPLELAFQVEESVELVFPMEEPVGPVLEDLVVWLEGDSPQVGVDNDFPEVRVAVDIRQEQEDPAKGATVINLSALIDTSMRREHDTSEINAFFICTYRC